jgi:hypothetical protein
MSLLGNDALGQWALGHPPDASSGASNIILIAATGVFILAGQDATMPQSFSVDSGLYSLVGNDESFKLVEVASVGAYSLTGVAQSFAWNWANLAAGVFSLSGQATAFSYKMVPTVGVYTFTGNDAIFSGTFIAGTLVAETGVFSFTGNPATLSLCPPIWRAPGGSLSASWSAAGGAPGGVWNSVSGPATSSWAASSLTHPPAVWADVPDSEADSWDTVPSPLPACESV